MLQCCAKSSHFLPRCAVTALRYLGVGGRGASAQALSGRPGEVVCGAGRREDKHVAQPSAKHAVVPRRECSEDEVHDADVCADADDEDLKRGGVGRRWGAGHGVRSVGEGKRGYIWPEDHICDADERRER